MDVILLERIEKLGSIGDVVKVKNGYARNFLLPRGKALRANESNRKVFEANREKIEAQNAERRSAAEGDASKVEGARVQLIRQASNAGHLYGSVVGPRPRRGAGGPGPQDRQAPDRARPADQVDRRPGGEDRASPRSVGDDQRQRRPLARRGRAAGAGQGRDGRDVREGRRRLHRGARRDARAGRDRAGAGSRRGAPKSELRPRRLRPKKLRAEEAPAEEAPEAEAGETAEEA